MGQKRCSICGEEMLGYGHNAEPINSGRCCDACDDLYVFPIRLCYESDHKEWADVILEAAANARKQ